MKTILTFLIAFYFVGLSFGQTPSQGNFKTVSSGTWSDENNWEVYFFGSWISAPGAPDGALNAVEYFIDDDIILDGSTTSVTLASSTSLVINSGASLTVSSSGYIDATSGTLTNNAGTSGLILESDASGTANLVSNSSPDGTLECYVSADNWHLIGPVHNTSANPLFYTGYMQSWIDQATGGSWEVQDPSTSGGPDYSMTRGYGDAFYFVSNGFTAEIAGVLTGSALPVTGLVNSTGDVGNDADGYYCLANPFPCAIDLGSCSSTNLIGSIQIYTGADYETTAGLGSTIIGPSQGFFVQVSGGSTGTFTFPTSAKTTNTQSLYKSSDTDLIKFRLSDATGKTNSPLLIRINDEATFDYDKYFDVINIWGASTCGEVTVNYAENFDLSVLGIPHVDNEYSVDLNFKKGESNEYAITLTNSDIENIVVSLRDNSNGNTFIFTDNIDTYEFTADDDQESRFTLTLKSATGIESLDNIENIRTWSFGDQIYISQDNPENGIVEVYDISGKLVYSENLNEVTLQKLPFHNHPDGIYIVKLIFGNNTFSQKIIK